MSVVLMYHALYRGEDTSDIDQEDLPYAVSESNFIAQLDSLVARTAANKADQAPDKTPDKSSGKKNGKKNGKSSSLFTAGQAPDVVITFDDGHRSNLEIAAPLLRSRGLSAYYFITSDFIGQRSGFMSEEQLATLAAISGMLIGSHGVSHRFFDDLSQAEARDELIGSREKLISLTGQPCRSISFPGGRYDEQTLQLLKSAGYRQWFGSQIGTVSSGQSFSTPDAEQGDGENALLEQQQHLPLERIAVRCTTTLDEFARMIGPDERYFKHHRRRSQAKTLLRRILGNRLYHGLYKSVSAR